MDERSARSRDTGHRWNATVGFIYERVLHPHRCIFRGTVPSCGPCAHILVRCVRSVGLSLPGHARRGTRGGTSAPEMGALRIRGDGNMLRLTPRARHPCCVGAHKSRASCHGGVAMNAATQFGSSGTNEIFRLLQTEEVRLVSIFGSSNGEGKKFANYILDL